MTTDTNTYGVKYIHETLIDGVKWRTTLMPAGEGFEHLPVLLQVASSPAGAALDTVMAVVKPSMASGADLTGAQLRDAMMALGQTIISAGGVERVKALLAHTEVHHAGAWKRVMSDFDAIFQGRYMLLAKVLGWVLEVNFAPFLAGGLSGVWSRLQAVKRSWQDGLNPSPGASTSEDGSGLSSD